MKKKISIVVAILIGLVVIGLGMHLAANGFDLQAALRNMHGGG